MRAFANYNEVSELTEVRKLPAGAYEVRIIRAEEQNSQNGSCALCILFDISEGEYKDFFHEKFTADKKSYPQNARYKGVYRLWYANDGQDDEYAKFCERKMKTALKRISESNNLNIDFTREWDGNALKGCKAGLIFQDQEYDYNGHHGFSAQPYGIVTLDDLREGNFKIPEPKRLKKGGADSSTGSFEEAPSDDDLPF